MLSQLRIRSKLPPLFQLTPQPFGHIQYLLLFMYSAQTLSFLELGNFLKILIVFVFADVVITQDGDIHASGQKEGLKSFLNTDLLLEMKTLGGQYYIEVKVYIYLIREEIRMYYLCQVFFFTPICRMSYNFPGCLQTVVSVAWSLGKVLHVSKGSCIS